MSLIKIKKESYKKLKNQRQVPGVPCLLCIHRKTYTSVRNILRITVSKFRKMNLVFIYIRNAHFGKWKTVRTIICVNKFQNLINLF